MIPKDTLYARIRKRVDLNDSTFLDDTLLQEWCIDGYFEFWDMMVASAGQEAPLARATIATVANQDYIDPVPPYPTNLGTQWVVNLGSGTDSIGDWSEDYAADPYLLRRLEWDGAGTGIWTPLRRGNFTSDPRTKAARAWGIGAYSASYYPVRAIRTTGAPTNPSTIVTGSPYHFYTWRIYVDPIPAAVYSLQLWYVAVPPIVWRTYGTPNQIAQVTFWPDEGANYVAEFAAARAAEKSEMDPMPFRAELARIKQQLETYLAPMDTGGPKLIADHRQYQRERNLDPFWDRRR